MAIENIFKMNLGLVGKLKQYVYYLYRGILRRRIYCIPIQPGTPPQLAVWEKFRKGVKLWQDLTIEEKTVYNIKAIPKKMEGFNLFMSKWLKQ